MTRQEADAMTYAQLDAADVCECGQALATHSPLPKPKPLASWKSQRETERAQSKTSSRLRW